MLTRTETMRPRTSGTPITPLTPRTPTKTPLIDSSAKRVVERNVSILGKRTVRGDESCTPFSPTGQTSTNFEATPLSPSHASVTPVDTRETPTKKQKLEEEDGEMVALFQGLSLTESD